MPAPLPIPKIEDGLCLLVLAATDRGSLSGQVGSVTNR
jgi:hypothetical protein